MAEVLGNIVLIGDAAVGKSSVINMIAGTKVAQVSKLYNGAGGTFEFDSYILPVHDRNYKFFDTAGIDDGDDVKRAVAIANLYKLITRLDGGISLLMFCMSRPRVSEFMHKNWKLIHGIICKKEVPTLLVITGLENEGNMDKWWWDNREMIEDQGICPDDTACITTIRGRRLRDGSHAFDDQYEESQSKISNVILNRVLLRTKRVDKFNWFYTATRSIFSFFGWAKTPSVVQEIVTQCNLPRGEATRLVEVLDAL